MSACSSVNLKHLEFETMGRDDFHRRFQRTDMKIHDALGVLGALHFDYFVYLCREELDETGWSNGYILVASALTLKRVPSTIKKNIVEVLKTSGVDAGSVEEKDLVVVATHENCVLGQQSMTVFFYPRQKEEKESESRDSQKEM